MATINGTAGDDNLIDTNDTDTLNGLGGNDTITVTANQDIANGGTGSDRLVVSYSAATSPVVLSIDGSDAEGYFGTITESVARGVDFTGIEHFTITSGSADDNITTGSGDDVVTTGSGAATVNTGAGNDTITTGSGNDVVNAGAGDDVVTVGTGHDIADGGDGVDGISASVAFGVNWNLQTNSYSGSNDNFTNFEYFKSLTLSSSPNTIVTRAEAFNDVINTSGGFGGTTITILNGVDNVNFIGTGPSRLIVDYSAATGSVTMTTSRISSILTTGWTANVREGDGSSRSVRGTGVRDLDVTTGSGNDDLVGAAFDDTFRTNGGNDTVNGGDGSDTFALSGNRANYLVTQNADSSLTIVDTRAGSPDGTDTVRNVESFAFADGTVALSALLANPPAVDLNGAAFGTDNSANYSEGGPPAILAPAAVVTDADSASLGGAAVRISSGFQSGLDQLTIGGAISGTISGIAFSYNGLTGVLTLSGTAPVADYQAALRQVAFSTTSTTPTERPTISWTLHDGTVTGPTANTELIVEASDDDVVTGTPGDDILDGGAGNDSMSGLGGNDWYVIRQAGDLVFEEPGGGTADRVFAYVDWTLNAGSHVEIVGTYNHTASDSIDLTGNELSQVIQGNAGNNILDGGGAGDALAGFGGDDWYVVRDGSDQVFEGAGEGSDRVFAYASWTLSNGARVETLSTYNAATSEAFDLTGNDFSQTIYGNAGANRIDGKYGTDTLFGDAGADVYAFTSVLGADNVDRIFGFESGIDKLAFAGVTPAQLAAGAFRSGTAAQDADDRIIYDPATGALYYDGDGAGAGAQVQFATLMGAPPLGASDFAMI